jgi:hypothetical protein
MMLLLLTVVAIVVAVAVVGPDVVSEARRIAYCMQHRQESIC